MMGLMSKWSGPLLQVNCSARKADLTEGPKVLCVFMKNLSLIFRDENFKTLVPQYIAKRKAQSTAANIPLCE